MKIIEPQHNTYEPEYRYLISNLPDLACKVFISGQVNINIGLLKGNKDDTITNEYLVKLKVGPYWKKIHQIVPQVSVTGFSNVDSDDDDEQKWQIRNINYILIPTIFQNVSVNELELNFTIEVKGQSSFIFNISYLVVCDGELPFELDRQSIDLLNLPGPIHTQNVFARNPFIKTIPPYSRDEVIHKYQIHNSEINYVISGSHAMDKTNQIRADSLYIPNYTEFCLDTEFPDITDAILFINVNGFGNTNSDEDDTQSWGLTSNRWEKVKINNSQGYFIKIVTDLGLSGKNSFIEEISYLIYAKGKSDPTMPAIFDWDSKLNLNRISNIKDYKYKLLLPHKKDQKEFRLGFPILSQNPFTNHVLVSRNIDVSGFNIKGDPNDDNTEVSYDFYLEVGPSWRVVNSVVSSLYISSFENKDSDEDDVKYYQLVYFDWYLANGISPFINEVKIILRFKLFVKGASSHVRRISYSVSAIGQLGEKGLQQ